MKKIFTLIIGTFIFLNLHSQVSCVDSSLINPTAICTFIYDPVCGCNGVTYNNDCLAENFGGVTSWISGPCSSNPPQVSICENFDLYQNGDPIAQSSPNWNTWGELTVGTTAPFADDANISSTLANSGTNSLYFAAVGAGGPQDIVLPFGTAAPYELGVFEFSSMFYINSGTGAYFNFQAENIPGNVWSLDCKMDLGSLVLENSASGLNYLSTTYPEEVWFELKLVCDLTNNNWELFLDGVSQGSFTNLVNKIASLDFYPLQGNQFYIDDVCWSYTAPNLQNLNAQTILVNSITGLSAQTINPSIDIRNLGVSNITSFDLDFEYNGTTITENITGVNILTLDEYNVNMTNGITLIGGINSGTATVYNINGLGPDDDPTDDSMSIQIEAITPAAGKLVIGELTHATWNGWAPRGIVASNWMDKDYEGYWQAIAVHNGDPMTNAVYDNGIAPYISGYPSALLDRGSQIDPSAFKQDFLQRIQLPPSALLTNSAELNGNILEVDIHITFQTDVIGNWKLACVITEDSVSGTTSGYDQSNAYSGGGSGSLIDVDGSDWANMPSSVPASQMVYHNVARGISPNFNGGLLPSSSYSSGDTLTVSFNFNLDASWDQSQIKIVGMLIDPNSLTDNGSSTTLAEALYNQISYGCTDFLALNYDPLAIDDDGSCVSVLWADDCSDASTWVFTNSSFPPLGWNLTTNVDVQSQCITPLPLALQIFNSTTASNGYMIINSDAAPGNQDWNGTPIIAEFTNATPIDLTGYANVQLTFQHSFRWWSDTRGVRVSGDNGVTWTDFEITDVNTYSTPNQDSENPHISTFNISSIAAYQSQVLIQFYYNDNDYWGWYWTVDDIQITEVPAWDCTPFGCADLGIGNGMYINQIDCETDGSSQTGCFIGFPGCTDPLADNYDPLAGNDDGSCIYSSNCMDLFISEYVEGSGNNKALEIYNPTANAIDLSSYIVIRYPNGSTSASSQNAVQLVGTINPDDVHVGVLEKLNPNGTGTEFPVADSLQAKADAFYCADYNISNAFYFNGNDVIVLAKGLINDIPNAIIVDVFGKVGEDPVGGWTDNAATGYTSSGYSWTANHTLIRKYNIQNGDPNGLDLFNPSLEWDSLPMDSWGDLGMHNSICNPFSNTNSIYDIVSNSSDHTTLKVAIDACALNGVLSDPGSLTLFAPTDAAFNLLPAGTVTALLNDIPQLTDILKYHVVGASVMSSMLSNNQVVTTLLGTDVTVTINSMGVFIDNAMVTVADIVADNGVVHVIDAVLIPTTIAYACTDPAATNYDPAATLDNGSCIYCNITNTYVSSSPSTLSACDGFLISNSVSNYPIVSYNFFNSMGVSVSTTNFALNLCNDIYVISIVDSAGCEYSDTIIVGVLSVFGCINPAAYNYDSTANIDDGSCQYCDLSNSFMVIQNTPNNCDGLILANASSSNTPINYLWSNGSIQNNITGLCSGIYTVSTTDAVGCIIDTSITIGQVSVLGCTGPSYCNYDPLANIDDGSCAGLAGCMDPLYAEYNSIANCDDGSCNTLITNTLCAEDSPTGLYVDGIIHSRATINWDNMNSTTCVVDQYRIKYREVGTSSITQKTMGGPVGSCTYGNQRVDKQLYNLTGATTYEYQMKAWYCGGGTSAWTVWNTFTTADDCPNVGNFTVYGANPTKATFDWDDSNGSYEFVRIKMRIDSISNPVGSDWFQVGGFGVLYGTYTKNKNGLVAAETYRAQARTFCDPNGGAYNSLAWTALATWTQPTSVRLEGGSAIANLDVYPNPSRDVFNISFTSEEIQDLRVRVLNVIGEVVYTENLEQFIGEYTKAIDLATYTKGVYFLEITTNYGVVNKKLIHQ